MFLLWQKAFLLPQDTTEPKHLIRPGHHGATPTLVLHLQGDTFHRTHR